MKGVFFTILLFALFLGAKTNDRVRVAFSRLDPTSLSQNLAFYELYPNSKEGHLAKKRIEKILLQEDGPLPSISTIDISPIIHLVNRTLPTKEIEMDEKTLLLIERLGSRLHNRTLIGYKIWSENEMLSLPYNEVDLCRALFLADKASKKLIRTYEAMLDLMALQIQARVGENASHKEIIHAINKYIFFDLEFRFPPHSLSTKKIDDYTSLPTVIDSRKGVCLGVSILYLSLAQRLQLPLEIITPPGHIFVRYRLNEREHLNIETTARGIDIPTSHYLNIEVKALQERNMKEVVGLAFINQASVSLSQKEYKEALSLYEKAHKYLPDDPLVQELLGVSYLITGEKKKGESYLRKIAHLTSPYHLGKDTLVEDYFQGYVDVRAIQTLFSPSEEEGVEALTKRRKELQKIIHSFPKFRMAYLQLASSYLHQSRLKEALVYLEKCHALDPEHPIINYYLAMVYYERKDYQKAWNHFLLLEKKAKKENHYPRMLTDWKMALMQNSPYV